MIARSTSWARRNKERVNAKRRALRANPEYRARELARDRATFLSRRDNDPDYASRIKLRNRNYKLKYLFGITEVQYNELYTKQNGVCGICQKPQTPILKGKNKGQVDYLAVDHCHVTGKVRGLLCKHCNTGIGVLGDDAASLERAYKYLLAFEKDQ